ncbi:hypothetical protein C1E23_15485 [Pseudoalteromonas phenolica]|uniref:Uncharacterized protein n=1 Tax=Pseudoalteromonas phenolica TaxID=161398 RepID=A0A4Q7IJ56_9GAMM|nr:hypothetical protein C1E23_15485 [Pseudoalteromonas phenolica]
MNYIIIATTVLLITLLGVYLVLENNRKKAKCAEKLLFNQRHSEVVEHFKHNVSDFVSVGALPSNHSCIINCIVGNFFVVQPHTEDNLNQLERIVELFILTVGEQVHIHRDQDDMDGLQEKLVAFARELPTNGAAYNKDFYHESLPAMITLIKGSNTDKPSESTSEDDTEQNNDGDNISEQS